MRTKSFSYTYSELKKLDDTKLKEILLESEKINEGDAHILSVGDLYMNNKEDALYYVREIKNKGTQNLIVFVDPLIYIGKQKGERISDLIKGQEQIDQKVKILNFKRKLLGD